MTLSAQPRLKVAPVLAATVATVLLLWLLFRAADIFLLLFVAVVFSLYLGAVRDWIVRRFKLPPGIAFFLGLILTLGGIVGLITLLVPPVVEQTRELFAAMPRYVAAWQGGLQRMLLRYPRLQEIWSAESERMVGGMVAQAEGAVTGILPQVVGFGHVLVNVISILVMAIFLTLNPATYREYLIALFPPLRRDLVRDVLRDIGSTLRSWIVGQILAMIVLAILTAIGLFLLDVPYWLTFGVFTGAVAIVPFFGTVVSSILPALFVLGGDGVFGFGPGVHALLVVALGFLIHIIEANFVIPRIMQKQMELPPVLTMMSVLVVGRLLGVAGLPVAVPLLATMIVIVRRVVINRIYEGQSFQRPGGARDRVLVLRVPAPDGGVIVTADPPLDVLRLTETSRKTA